MWGYPTILRDLFTWRHHELGPWMLAGGIAWLCISALIYRLDRDL
jgi:hypothetical protein